MPSIVGTVPHGTYATSWPSFLEMLPLLLSWETKSGKPNCTAALLQVSGPCRIYLAAFARAF